MQKIIEKWKINKGLLASKMTMPLGTFCNKLNPKHSSEFSDAEIIRLKMVLKELYGDLEFIMQIDEGLPEPISIPTDQEIETKAYEKTKCSDGFLFETGFEEGAKHIRNLLTKKI